ncbi:MAG: UbiA family prenyltransferase [Bacteroidetes bacterium]|nr:UbiA family prenyltransferase [Bacteroidota bacterium]
MPSTTNNTVSNYLSLVKFSHTLFALPFAVIGFFLAIHFTEATFSIKLFLLVIFCMIFARSAAMAFNRFIDRKFDVQNERTAIREIPSGIIKPANALMFVIANCILFIITTYFINTLCFYLSPVALLVILGYSFTKRFTAFCHLILGVGLSLAPIGAYLSVTGKFDLLPLFFSFAVLFWVSGFDIIYALQDEVFDKSNELKSIPVWLGKKGALNLSTVFHIISALFIIVAGWYAHFEIWYWMGTGIFIGLLFYQHTLVKPSDLSKVNLAFATTNGIASVVFSIFVLIDLYI